MPVEVLLPQFGIGMHEGTVNAWLVDEGGRVELDQAIVEIEAEKAITEVVAPAAGTLIKRLADEGDVVEVHGVLALIEPDAG